MHVDLTLINCRVCIERGFIEAGIAIDNGRIVKIAKETNLPRATATIDAKGKLALPGLIDSHVHLRDEQLAYREDFQSGTKAAVAGGVTTVVDMPNNRPLTMSAETIKDRMHLAESRIFANVAFNSAFPTNIEEVPNIVKAGASGFKLYLIQQLGGVNIDDDKALLNAFKAVSNMNVPIAVHAEDRKTIEKKKDSLVETGRKDINAFLEVHTPEAEVKAIKRVAELTKKSHSHAHICHVSSAAALNAVFEARKIGCIMTCEVTPHHLLLTNRHLRKIGNLALEIPPMRKSEDLQALWEALQKGFIDTIASDHAPHSLEEKCAESVWDVKPGIVGLETILPLLLTQVNKERLTVKQLMKLTCEKPAEIFHLRDRGSLNSGSFADITVVDLKKVHRIDASKFYSKAKFSPFDGMKVKGMPVKTFLNGQLIMDEGEIVANAGTGRVIR